MLAYDVHKTAEGTDAACLHHCKVFAAVVRLEQSITRPALYENAA